MEFSPGSSPSCTGGCDVSRTGPRDPEHAPAGTRGTRPARDVVTQIAAASKALEQVGFRMLAAGLTSCLQDPEKSEAEGYPITEVERLFLKLA